MRGPLLASRSVAPGRPKPNSWWARKYYDEAKLELAGGRQSPIESGKRLKGPLAWECRVCGERFSDEEDAGWHVRSTHPGEDATEAVLPAS